MHFRFVPIAVALIAIAGCGSDKDLDEDKAKTILEANPVSLDREQVTLSQKEFDCGVQAELWASPIQFSPDRSTARLNEEGKRLGFSDDIVIESTYHMPYAQVQGPFPLQIDQVTNIRDGEDSGTKLVTAKAAVKIQNDCFPNPLPLMAVNKGKFQEDSPVRFLFGPAEAGWRLEKLVH
jgi:hypothetical protein